MLKNLMQISEHIRDKVSVDYFFIKGKIDLDADYFINKIKESCQSKDNMNYKTNIQSLMTPFQFFSKDPNFLQILKNFIELIDSNYDFVRYCVSDAWGFEVKQNEKTKYHAHARSIWSGVLYLNSSTQELKFPEINKSVKPERGVFALFSPFLMHGCEPNNDEISKFGISFNLDELVEKW